MQIAIRAHGSAISGAVPDSTLEAIDRIFDFVDKGVDAADRVLNRGKQTEDRARRARRPEVIDAEAKPKANTEAKPRAKETTAMARKPRFYVVESIVNGGTLFVVTDGGSARAECTSRELAEQILRALEKTS